MNATAIEAVIGAATFLMSAGISLYIAGRKSAQVEARIDSKASREEVGELKNQLSVMSVTLGEIKGMFRLTLKDGQE